MRINTKAETCVPGLYAAGDNALCAHGYLTGAFTIGEAAAESAAEYVRTVEHAAPNQSVIDAFLAKVERRLAQKENQISVEEFEFKVRRNINDYLASPKTEDKLQRGMKWMDRFMTELDEMVYVEDTHDLIKTLEVENIIVCAKTVRTRSLRTQGKPLGELPLAHRLPRTGRRKLDEAHRDDDGRQPAGYPSRAQGSRTPEFHGGKLK